MGRRSSRRILLAAAGVLTGLVLLVPILVQSPGLFPPPAMSHPGWVIACFAIAIVLVSLPGLRRPRLRLRQALFESKPTVFYATLFIAADRTYVSAVLLTSGILFVITTAYAAQFRRYGPDYQDVENTLPRLMQEFQVHRALVFMKGRGYFATGFMRNRLDLGGDIVFARNLGESADRTLMAAYPGRRYYMYKYIKEIKDAALSEILKHETGLEYRGLHEPAVQPLSGGKRQPGRRKRRIDQIGPTKGLAAGSGR